jgi:hypothetical protein
LSYVTILDPDGKTIQPPMFRSKSVSITLKPKQPHVEQWVLTLEKPGKYHVTAHSQYSVGDENKDLEGGRPHVHNIKSEPAEVTII